MASSNFFEYSDIGKRKTNQDDYIIKTYKGYTLLAVADGMGGHRGGETASRLTIDKILKVLIETGNSQHQYRLKDIIQKMFHEADVAIREMANKNPSLHGMGTTLCCVLIKGTQFAWGNVGDSRIYYYTNGYFQQITTDHTVLQDYINEFGNEIPENVLQHSHALTRALDGSGSQPDVFPGNQEAMNLNKGEAFLLCSDGLTPSLYMDYEELFTQYLLDLPSLRDTATQLAEHAEQSGSTDNITVVMFEHGKIDRRVEAPYEPPEPSHVHYGYEPSTPKPRKKIKKIAVGVFSLLFAVLLALVGTWYFFIDSGDKIPEIIDEFHIIPKSLEDKYIITIGEDTLNFTIDEDNKIKITGIEDLNIKTKLYIQENLTITLRINEIIIPEEH